MPEAARSLCIVGPQPPPRHGVSAVNEAVSSLAQRAGLSPICLNTAPASLARSFSVRVGRIKRIWQASAGIRFHSRQNRGVVYLSLSGGMGLIWEALFAWQARRTGAQVIVHHHSFRYLDRAYWPMRLLVRAGGRGALHVVLGRVMEEALLRRHPDIGETIILSNAVFVGTPLPAGIQRTGIAPGLVGLLANLSSDKGLDDFLTLAEASQSRGLPWRFILAGPFENEVDRDRVMPRIAMLTNLEYRGPLYGEAKTAFLEEIDIFVFPTRYRHEAEPLVLLEAMRHGCPVIAYARGCIEEMIGKDGGRTIPAETEFTGPALDIMEQWRSEGPAFSQRCDSARLRFASLHEESTRAMHVLLDRFKATHHD